MSTPHNQARLDRANACQPGMPTTLTECNRLLNAVHDAICGIQSTDDPDPAYETEHRRLWAEVERLQKIREELTLAGVNIAAERDTMSGGAEQPP